MGIVSEYSFHLPHELGIFNITAFFKHLVKSSNCTYHLHITQKLWCGIYSSVFAVVALTLLRVIVTVL